MTQHQLQLLLQEELARLHLAAERLVVSLSERGQWLASFRLRGRAFELGSAFHRGFFCRCTTAQGKASLVPDDAPPLFGDHRRLVRSGLQLIAAARHDPENAAVAPAVL